MKPLQLFVKTAVRLFHPKNRNSTTLITNRKSLWRALRSKESFGNVAIIAGDKTDLLAVISFVRRKGAQVVFQQIVQNAEDFCLADDLLAANQIILAVFDGGGYKLRSSILQSCKATHGELPEITSPSYPYDPFVEDELFVTVIQNLAEKTEWDTAFWATWKSYGVFQLLRMALRLPGDCFEFGCYRGYSAAFLAETMEVFGVQGKKVFLFDTWGGMPSSHRLADNFYQAGNFSDTSLERIQRTLKPWQPVFEFVRGDICATLPRQTRRDLCYGRIDVDLYEPARVVLETVYEWVVDGGVVYLDDYVSASTVGERLAVDEFLWRRRERPFYMLGDRAYIIKGV